MRRATGTEAAVCDDIAMRQTFGLSKYGTTVADNPLTKRQWLRHAYEESLDLAVYLRRVMDETSKEPDPLPVLDTTDRLLTKGWSIIYRRDCKMFHLVDPGGDYALGAETYRKLLSNILFAELPE